MTSLIIGIDPDLEKSGVATLENKSLELACLSFPDLMDYLTVFKSEIKKVVIEAGWLNGKSNFHSHAKQSKFAGERIAKNVGENHATGKLIKEMCEAKGLVVQLIQPTKNKLDAEQFKRITGVTGRTNQEVRDAGMLIWGMV